MPPVEQLSQIEDTTGGNVETDKQSVFGYVFHTGLQSLAVTVPGDVIPVKFGSHTVLTGLRHDEQSPDIMIMESGIYEISYSVSMQAAYAVHAALSLQANGETIEGSLMAKLVNTYESVFSAAVLAELKANTEIRLVMTSGTAVSAELTGNGVSASLMIKKLN
jgi:hypothetical protein